MPISLVLRQMQKAFLISFHCMANELMYNSHSISNRNCADWRAALEGAEAEPRSIPCQSSVAEQNTQEPCVSLQACKTAQPEQALPLVTAASESGSFPPLRHLIDDQSAGILTGSQEEVEVQEASRANKEAAGKDGNVQGHTAEGLQEAAFSFSAC